ncbi:MAG: dockerin type I domain-containing protein [Gemmatimonadota bacterium]
MIATVTPFDSSLVRSALRAFARQTARSAARAVRRSAVRSVARSVAFSGVLLLAAIPASAQKPSAAEMREGDPKDRREWLAASRGFPANGMPADKIAAMREIRISAARGAYASQVTSDRWQPMGPVGFVSMNTPYSSTPMPDEGRFTSVAIHPRNGNIILAGGGSAGVWRTINGGASWQPLGDYECSTSIGSVTMDPVDPNIVYAGTGEIFDPTGFTDGCGILKSTNMGDSWTRVAGTQLASAGQLGGLVYRIAIDRATAGSATTTTLFAATSLGVLRSTNSGSSWSTVLQGIVTDVIQDPTRTEVIYAAVGNPQGAAGNGVYRSTNGGATWNIISQQLGAGNTIGRTALSVTPARPGSVWAIMGDPTNRKFRTLARFDEFSSSWTLLPANGIQFVSDLIDFGAQSEYNLVLGVDPVDENRIIIGGVRLFRSRDGGNNFHQIAANVHSDWHGLAFDARDTRHLVVSSDGGIFTSFNGGDTFRSLNNGISATQFYPGFQVHPTNPAIVVGGTQDNGSMMSGGALLWSGISFGDGGWAMIDYTNPNIVMTSSQNGNLQRHDLALRTFQPLPNHLNFQAQFITPFIIDPITPRTIYAGTRALERSVDFGTTWTVFSPVLPADVTAMAIGRAAMRTVMVGTRSGFLAVSADGGANWAGGTIFGINRSVSDIASDPNEPLRFAITYAGFGVDKIVLTQDANRFSQVTGNLPDIPVNAFAFTPTRNRFFIGTDIGVFETTDGGATWGLTQGLPLVPVSDLIYHAASNRLMASTYGRGIWSLPLSSEPPVLRGDVDRNGLVNAADALLIQRGLANISLPSPLTILPHGDANCNGALDAADALIVLKFAVGLGTAGTCVNSAR